MWLKARSGTEVVTIEMAMGLARRGHDIVVFSPDLGPSAESLRAAGITVTNRLDAVAFAPDVVHGNHSVDLVHGLIRFPDAPGVFVCHNSDHWACSPPDLSQVRAFVAVDRACRDRIVNDLPRVRDDVRIIQNAVDLERYRSRDALPARPSRALALTKFSDHLAALHAACAACGLQLDQFGPGTGQVVDDLPDRLKQYDLVFATARMALEAMAVGCAVIVVDARGLAGMVTAQNCAAWREDNYGRRILTRPVTADAIMEEIARYDATDAAAVAADVRAHHALDRILASYEQVYRGAAGAAADRDRVAREWSNVMRQFLPLMDGIPPVSLPDVGHRIAWLEKELAARARDVAWRDNELAARARDVEWRENELAARARDVEWRDAQIAARDEDATRRENEIAARDAILGSNRALIHRLAENLVGRFRSARTDES
jgi:glycosyltransferase involved in cell wall biosynthesis